MKKTLLFLSLVLASCLFVKAQNVPNRGFETWESDTLFDEPDDWNTGNAFGFLEGIDTLVALQSSDAQHGNSSLRLESIVTASDTVTGFAFSSGFVSGSGPGGFNWIDGFPYTSKPDSIKAWLKYDIMAGDSAFIGLALKNNGTVLFDTIYKITGTQAAWTEMSFAIDSIGTSPDTCLIALTAANPDAPVDGSWMMVDDLRFVNSTDTIPNGSFEMWAPTIGTDPVDWTSPNLFSAALGDSLSVEMDTDAHSGMYSMSVKTVTLTMFQQTWGFVSSSETLPGDEGFQGGFPVNDWGDSLSFWYKYSSPGVDTGMAIIGYKEWDSVGDSSIWHSSNGLLLPATNTWTLMTIPVNGDTLQFVDSAIVIFTSSKAMFDDDDSVQVVGSKLLVDDLWLHHQCDWIDTTMNFFASDSVMACDMYEIDPGVTFDTYAWSNGDTTATSIVYLPGWYALTLADTGGCSVTDSIYVDLTPCPGFEDGPTLFGLQVFPNPTSGQLNVSYTLESTELVEINLMTVTGMSIARSSSFGQAGKNQTKLDLSDVAAGVYFVRMQIGENVVHRKVVKQ